mmetsp:Transcript_2009/g.4675  ORF Transcript_2009/g.4675 Transcript_2009/m.4675 type:complete len:226 (-) Transcript_2009:19-696(-)
MMQPGIIKFVLPLPYQKVHGIHGVSFPLATDRTSRIFFSPGLFILLSVPKSWPWCAEAQSNRASMLFRVASFATSGSALSISSSRTCFRIGPYLSCNDATPVNSASRAFSRASAFSSSVGRGLKSFFPWLELESTATLFLLSASSSSKPARFGGVQVSPSRNPCVYAANEVFSGSAPETEDEEAWVFRGAKSSDQTLEAQPIYCPAPALRRQMACILYCIERSVQ